MAVSPTADTFTGTTSPPTWMATALHDAVARPVARPENAGETWEGREASSLLLFRPLELRLSCKEGKGRFCIRTVTKAVPCPANTTDKANLPDPKGRISNALTWAVKVDAIS